MSDAGKQEAVADGGNLLWFYALLGSIFSALALISLTQKLFDVGLVPVMQGVLDTYRDAVHPLMSRLLGWVHWIFPDWHIPVWLKDLYSLSFVGGFALARALSMKDGVNPIAAGLMTLIIGIFYGITMFGLVVWLAAVSSILSPNRAEPLDRLVPILLGFALVGSVAFFAINSQL